MVVSWWKPREIFWTLRSRIKFREDGSSSSEGGQRQGCILLEAKGCAGSGLVLVDACEDQGDDSESPASYPALLAQVHLLSHMTWVLKASSFSLADYPERARSGPILFG